MLKPVSKAGLAAAFGVSARTVRDWAASGAPAPDATGKYNLPAWIAWRLESVRASSRPADAAAVAVELKQAQRDLALERLSRERGETVSTEESNRRIAAALRWCIATLDAAGKGLRTTLAGVPPADVPRLVTTFFNEQRRELLTRGEWPDTCSECSAFFESMKQETTPPVKGAQASPARKRPAK